MVSKDFYQVGEYQLTEEEYLGKVKIDYALDLCSLTSLPKGFNPTIDGDLMLNSVTSISEGFSPTVDGYFLLGSAISILEGFSPTVTGDLDLSSVTSISKGFCPAVDGHLWLDSVVSIPEGFSPTVTGDIDLSSVTSISKGFCPTVSGKLWISSKISIPEDFSPMVSGYLWLNSVTSIHDNFTPKQNYNLFINDRLIWQNDRYLLADGIFTEILNKRGKVYKVRKTATTEPFYLVTDGNGMFAHGNTIKEAKTDLIHKLSKRDKVERFKSLSLTDSLPFGHCIDLYRVATGACSFGVQEFIRANNIEECDYLVSEIIEKTKGAFGHEELLSFIAEQSSTRHLPS